MTTGVGINGFGRTAIIAPWAAVPSLPGGRLPLRRDDFPSAATTCHSLRRLTRRYRRDKCRITDRTPL